jgi:alkanesulfonate monooxygenase SsuD/methylene tetrahydromethanopterin reductase-like flavin-dependent oxidoreductase (luciferase family)
MRRAAERGDGWLPQGTRRDELPRQIAFVREHRKKARADAPIEIGANSEWLYVGKPPFDPGPGARTGSGEEVAASLRELRAAGVSHVGVRFRSRSCDELVEQIEAFTTQVAPALS